MTVQVISGDPLDLLAAGFGRDVAGVCMGTDQRQEDTGGLAHCPRRLCPGGLACPHVAACVYPW